MLKKTTLFFLCLSLFLSIPCCKKKLPTQPDIPTKILPTIEYFHANPESIKLEESSTLSWSTTNATAISISPGIGNVAATSTADVSPEDTTIYTLTATNSDGTKTASCRVEILKWAELTVSLDPAAPVFLWDPDDDICLSEFTILMKETAGVGGVVNSVLVTAWRDSTLLYTQDFGGGTFDAFQTLSRFISLIIFGQPTLILFGIDGVDNNGYTIELVYYFNITWTQNTGTMSLLKIVEGQNHHKLIN